MFSSGEPESYPLTEDNYQTHEDYLYSIDLINNGYYWEAHAYLEAIWNELGRQGDYADLCKILIKIGAWGVKNNLGHDKAAIGHLKRGIELLDPILTRREDMVGLSLTVLKRQIEDLISKNSQKIIISLI